MSNARYNSMKGSQKNSDSCYEGEDGPSSERDSVKAFGTRDQVNKMSGTGARTPDQAEYTLPKDQWRS